LPTFVIKDLEAMQDQDPCELCKSRCKKILRFHRKIEVYKLREEVRKTITNPSLSRRIRLDILDKFEKARNKFESDFETQFE
jgi:hypothetical protein